MERPSAAIPYCAADDPLPRASEPGTVAPDAHARPLRPPAGPLLPAPVGRRRARRRRGRARREGRRRRARGAARLARRPRPADRRPRPYVSAAGYSGTPLPKKLGIKPGHRLLLLSAPEPFELDLPEGVTVARAARGKADVIVSFHTERADLARRK